MRSQVRAQACVHSPATPSRWHRLHGHPKLRFGDRSGCRVSGKFCPQAKAGKHQQPSKLGLGAEKSAKRKADALSKANQNKMLSALSGESIDSSGSDSGSKEADSRRKAADSGIKAADDPAADVTIVKRASKVGTPKKKPVTLDGSIYDHPVIYDWAFGFRDYEAEVDFLFDAYEEIVGDEPLSFLEVGCGPAQHSMEMAESQLKVYCVDGSLEMLEYAAQLAAEDDIELTRVHADMRSFSLPDGAKVDLAACLLGTLQHMLTQEDVIQCFRRVSDALVSTGLFIIELNHPSQLFDGGVVASADTWTLEVEDAQLEIWWGHEGDPFDPFTQVLQKSIEIDVMLRGGERKVLRDNVFLRQFTYQEMLLLAQTAGFKVVQTYEDFALSSLIGDGEGDNSSDAAEDAARAVDASRQNKLNKQQAEEEPEDPFRMILVLQKQDAPAKSM